MTKNLSASEYIRHCQRLVRGQLSFLAIGYVRVSSGSQDRRRNLDHQEAKLRRLVKRLGGRLIRVYREVVSGWVLDEDRSVLVAAIAHAKRRGTFVVALSTDRLVRNKYFHDQRNQAAKPTVAEFEKLMEMGN